MMIIFLIICIMLCIMVVWAVAHAGVTLYNEYKSSKANALMKKRGKNER